MGYSQVVTVSDLNRDVEVIYLFLFEDAASNLAGVARFVRDLNARCKQWEFKGGVQVDGTMSCNTASLF